MRVCSAVGAVCVLFISASAAAQRQVTQAGGANALSTVAQRHMVRIAPKGAAPAYLMAVQRNTYGAPEGLHWFRSDDDGQSWRYYAPIFGSAEGTPVLHMTVDALVVGDDVATVISYDTTQTGFPSDADDPRRKVYFQWWRHDGAGAWVPEPRQTIAAPPEGQAFHRAVVARDSAGRLWAQAWRREGCSKETGARCPDNLHLWVSTDGGRTFQDQGAPVRLPLLGGGRLISLGDRLMMLWGDYSWDNPAQYLIRNDADPIAQWSGPHVAFADRDSIYHGAALSAVADGSGGLHLVYKDRRENLYYRHFDGTRFGERVFVDGASTSDWALQAAVTLRGEELFVCTNHPTTSTKLHAMRLYRLSKGFDVFETIDGSASFKGYPTAPERLPADAPTVPCAYSAGVWPADVKVARVAADPAAPEPEPTPAPEAPAPGPPPLATLQDDFSSSPLDPRLWNPTQLTSGDRVFADGGELVLAPAAADGRAGAFVTSANRYALRGSGVSVVVRSVTAAPAKVSTRLRLHPSGSGAWAHDVGFWFEYGALTAYRTRHGQTEALARVAYSGASMAHWRIGEDAGTVVWEVSEDGRTWVRLASCPSDEVTFSLDEVQLSFETKSWSTGAPQPGQARFASLNATQDSPGPEPEPEPAPQPDPDPAPGTLASLTDPFTSLADTGWFIQRESTGSTAIASSGKLSLTLEKNSGKAGVHVSSRGAYALEGSSVHVRVEAVTSPAAPASTIMVVIPALDTWVTQAGFWYERGTLYPFFQVSGQVTALAAVPYSAQAHAFWRLREADGVVFWETSADGATWKELARGPAASLAMDLRRVHLRFDSKAWSSGSSEPGAAIFSGLNL